MGSGQGVKESTAQNVMMWGRLWETNKAPHNVSMVCGEIKEMKEYYRCPVMFKDKSCNRIQIYRVGFKQKTIIINIYFYI